jgi:hypothetical protein
MTTLRETAYYFSGLLVLLSPLLVWVTKAYIDSRVKASFSAAEQQRKAQYDAELERVKGALAADGERLRHQLARREKDAERYGAKRHATYAKLYGLYQQMVDTLTPALNANHAAVSGKRLNVQSALMSCRRGAVPPHETEKVLREALEEDVRARRLYALTYATLTDRADELAQRIEAFRDRFALYLSDEVQDLCGQIDGAAAAFRLDPDYTAASRAEMSRMNLKQQMREELSGGIAEALPSPQHGVIHGGFTYDQG